MATLINDAEGYFEKELGPASRVLLINPPVEEQRYHWIRWNQPTELLRLSTWLGARHPGIDVRLIDFMRPDEAGMVPKHMVKDARSNEQAGTLLWHFGMPFEAFEKRLTALIQKENWAPDCVVISSLTSYWHVSIEKLLIKLCYRLGQRLRTQAKIALYGNYPRIEPEHAARQRDADVALTSTVNTRGYVPDFGLYAKMAQQGAAPEEAEEKILRLPNFFALDIEDPFVADHLQACLSLQEKENRRRKIAKRAAITVAFFNEDVCSADSQLPAVARFVAEHPKQVTVEGITGILPRSLSHPRLEQLRAANFRTLFVEHARTAGGGLDEEAYVPLREALREEEHARRTGRSESPWAEPGNVTGFVSIGLPGDDMDRLVQSTLELNSYFRAIILKPFGYSPRAPCADAMPAAERRARWKQPREASPQWYPYVARGSDLSHDDYANLIRWQSLLNRRVRGTTFDFLDDGNVARIVRETLVAESWKPRAGVR